MSLFDKFLAWAKGEEVDEESVQSFDGFTKFASSEDMESVKASITELSDAVKSLADAMTANSTPAESDPEPTDEPAANTSGEPAPVNEPAPEPVANAITVDEVKGLLEPICEGLKNLTDSFENHLNATGTRHSVPASGEPDAPKSVFSGVVPQWMKPKQ